MIMVVFDGLTPTPDIQQLITKYYIGNILLTTRNISSAAQVATLTHSLQTIAQSAGFQTPLMIGIEQENGMISRWGDGARGTQFPGAMALAATRSPTQAFDVAKATAKELAAVGINWNFAPVLDVLGEAGEADTGASVRAFGDDPETVGRFGVAFSEGLRAGGVGHCAKHFCRREPTSPVAESSYIPFRRAIAAGMDSVLVSSSIWPTATTAGYAKSALTLLRETLSYTGVTIADMTSTPLFLSSPAALPTATLTAVHAGIDILLLYTNPTLQLTAIHAIHSALSTRSLTPARIFHSSQLITRLKEHYFTWHTTLTPCAPDTLTNLLLSHAPLARKAYSLALTLVRDTHCLIPLRPTAAAQILLLTPVVKPLHRTDAPIDPFECFGRALARRHPHIVHAPYTAHGVTGTHVSLIKSAAIIIFVSANAQRPNGRSQLETAAAVQRIAYAKPILNIAACDPSDVLDDRSCVSPLHRPPPSLPR